MNLKVLFKTAQTYGLTLTPKLIKFTTKIMNSKSDTNFVSFIVQRH